MFQSRIVQNIIDPFSLKKSVDERNQQMKDSFVKSDLQSLSLHSHFEKVEKYLNNAYKKIGYELNSKASGK